MDWLPSVLFYIVRYLIFLFIDKVCLWCTCSQNRWFQNRGGSPPSWLFLNLNHSGYGQIPHICIKFSSLVSCSLWHSWWTGYIDAATMGWPLFPILWHRSLCSGMSVCWSLQRCSSQYLWCRHQWSLVRSLFPQLLSRTAQNPPHRCMCLLMISWSGSGCLLLPVWNFRILLSWVQDSPGSCDRTSHNCISIP